MWTNGLLDRIFVIFFSASFLHGLDCLHVHQFVVSLLRVWKVSWVAFLLLEQACKEERAGQSMTWSGMVV